MGRCWQKGSDDEGSNVNKISNVGNGDVNGNYSNDLKKTTDSSKALSISWFYFLGDKLAQGQ